MIEQPGNERINNAELETEMRKAYLDYSMSVIVARALPDVRDGAVLAEADATFLVMHEERRRELERRYSGTDEAFERVRAAVEREAAGEHART